MPLPSSPETARHDERLLAEIAPEIETLYERHLEHAREWYPHETTPWSMARDYTEADAWRPEEYPLSDGVRSALYVHLLTEDNLPYYTHTILNRSPDDHPMNEWTRRWTAEEARHSVAIRDWILATRAFDPKLLEQGRMVQMSGGQVPQPASLPDMLAYTSFQELATRVAHSNTGRKLGKELGGAEVMAKVAGDENLHYRFYRDAAKASLEVDPSRMVIAIFKQLRGFDMPGTGIPGFDWRKEAIAREGIYDGRQHLEAVVRPTLEHWQIDQLEGLDEEAEKAREGIARFLKVLGRAATAQEAKFARTEA
jgi:acyl-[acyl-carrier-protein] desaturase